MNEVLNRLGCVGLVVALVFPFGQLVFVPMAHALGELPFGAIETALTAVLGKGLHAALYG